MTAYIVLAYPDHVTVYADGATYDEHGIYRAPHFKVDVMPHIDALVVTRGSGAMGMVLKQRLGTYQSFSDLKVMMHVELLGAAADAHAMGDDINLEVIVAGIPDGDRPPEIYSTFISGDSLLDRDEGSLEVNDRGQFYATPGLRPEEYASAGLPEMETSGTAEEFYTAYMEAMRAIPRQMHRASELVGCNVGGFVSKTVLYRGMSATSIIHRWPDVIGEPLNGFEPSFRDPDRHVV